MFPFTKLNFPASKFRLKEENGKMWIFDDARKKYYQITPEEWVRQNCIHFLRDQKHFPISLISVERSINMNGQKLRYDLVGFSKKAKPVLLVECKAPEVKITQQTFDQIAVYNLELKVPFLMVTNGLEHYYCRMDFEKNRYLFLEELPEFPVMNLAIE